VDNLLESRCTPFYQSVPRMRQTFLKPALDLLFPPQCTVCGTLVAENRTLCTGCWNGITFISDPVCSCCGLPFDYDIGAGLLCGECMRVLPPFKKARSVLRYDDASRQLVLKLKFQDEIHLGATFGPWLRNVAHEMLGDTDCIIPVPLHYARFVSRRYNQALVLARALGHNSEIPVIPDGLARVRATDQQSGLSRKGREKNVRRAFRIPPRHAPFLKGKRVLLVDDVHTTGATLAACAKELIKNGISKVYAVTLARRC
jgi:ComF family protein